MKRKHSKFEKLKDSLNIYYQEVTSSNKLSIRLRFNVQEEITDEKNRKLRDHQSS